MDGVSLTIVEVQGSVLRVSLIPHTAEVTTLSRLGVRRDALNLEADLIAKYVQRVRLRSQAARRTHLGEASGSGVLMRPD